MHYTSFDIGLRNRIVGKDGSTLSTRHFGKVDGQGKRMIIFAWRMGN